MNHAIVSLRDVVAATGALALWACGGGTEVEITAQAERISMDAGIATCQVAADCSGVLPDYCMKCMGGTTSACMHWECIENQCQEAVCP
jgi:hypothetical protein